jgi:hypothetical protein
MITIQRSFFNDKKAAIAEGINVPVACNRPQLYRLIAAKLDIDVSDIAVAAGKDEQMFEAMLICDRIDARNAELACVGVAESLVEKQSTLLDNMAANIEKPRKLVKPKVNRDRLRNPIMADAFARVGLVALRVSTDT